MVSSALHWSPEQTHRIGVSVEEWAAYLANYLLCAVKLAIKVEVTLTEQMTVKRLSL